MEYANLLAVKSEIDKCVRCAACQAGCPTYTASFSETLSARGRIRLAKGLLEGVIPLSQRVSDDFNMCLSCMKCMEVCPAKIDTVSIFQAVRAEGEERNGGWVKRLLLRGILPYPGRLNALAKIVGVGSLLYRNAPEFLARFLPFVYKGRRMATPDLLQVSLRSLVADGAGPAPAREGAIRKVAYFSGCMTDLAHPRTGLAVIRELEKAGVEVVYPQGQVCCGAPAWFAGDNEAARVLAIRNVEALGKLEVDAVVVSCATCGSALSHLPVKLVGGESARRLSAMVVDFQKLMVELGAAGALEGVERRGKLKVTYHDPCHLRRGMGVWEEPRTLIKSLPNVEFIEMEGADACCGGAGAFMLDNPERSADWGAIKATAVAKSGADIVATSCPSCQLQLASALSRAGISTPVMHTADLVEKALAEAEPTRREPAVKGR